ncbi:MAG TPA: sigma 54-interacting transcriptional regulator [Pyrinomonadaceae bacterium]|jgi:transcriptional regulator with PAS, ATPase and Fis domain/tetratricopeptide (TPR) repeat protein
MSRRTHTGRNEPIKDASAHEAGVVDLASARLNSRKAATRESLAGELEEVRLLLDQGRSTEVQSRITSLTVAARHDPSLLAQARCALSIALEMQGRYRESLEAIRMYEAPESRTHVDAETVTRLRVQIGLAYNYAGDHPKAIALLNAALRETSEDGSDAQMGAIYVALARIYRSISEHPIARDYAQRALEHYRNTGDWRGLAESYFAIAMADMLEGNYEAALDNYEQALNLVGDYPAPYLLAKIYNNMAGACWFLKRPQEGIRHLEKSISYYERTEHKANATDGYNNLGINFILVGEWTKAQAALERALALASEVHANSPKLSMPLDSLGELHMLRGDLLTAQSYLERAVIVATEHNHKWYAGQAMRTLGRCLLAMNDAAGAREHGREALALAEAITDRQAICESRLLISEADLRCGELAECAEELEKVTEQTTDSVTDLGFAGEAQRMHGLLAMAQEDTTLATQHLSRSVTIFDILGDRYRGARAHYELGRAYAGASPERAAEHLSRAAHTFRELGARLDLARAEEALAALDRNAPQLHDERSALTQLLTLRLAEAVASRELLLRELAAVIHQETDARRVLVIEPDEDNHPRVAVAHGCTPEEAAREAAQLGMAEEQGERERLASKHDAALIPLRATNAKPALLVIAPRSSAALPGGIAIEPLLRVVELGMDVCALRAGAQAGRSQHEEGALAGASLMPGFIHSSPAMTRLVEEVHKIRSSDVTVLVTGESGTGKELVARAIHALSSRRAKVFMPFNCTAVPKELSEGYLFGYRRGAYTGAVNDSPGVIRTAEGGTLFLDEIGDLPLDVQPKLLRFLQEGEIQPLGEQRPVKVDVRIIAATNTDLEEMVADGRFREDLYYRLNVIRLRVPPLRERRSEIPTIVNYYINHYSAKFNRRDIEITPQAVDLMMVFDWPGNVRQLTNEIQRIVARAEDGTLITPDHLSPELRRTSTSIMPPALVTPINAVAATAPPEGTTLADALADLERRMIAEAMRKHSGNISRAARELGLTRRGLYLKLERHDLTASA